MNSQIAGGIERLALLSAVAVALGGAGGCGSTPLQIDGGRGAGGSSAGGRGGIDGGAGGTAGAGGACSSSSETLFCLPGSGATVDTCGDFLVTATCSGGQWVCPAGQGVPTRCRCPGLGSPICVCTSDGWQCGTGGAGGQGGGGGAGGGGGGCPSPLLYCGASGSPDMCSDTAMPATCQAGRWVCPPWTGNPAPCRCFGPPPPGCVCTDSGFQCATGGAGGRGGAGGGGGAGGRGGAGGQSGGAGGGGGGGAGGSGVPCADATTLEKCDARSDCHSVFVDPRNCACAALGCCARFARCADGDRALCTGGAIACDALTPYCELPYVVSYTQSCYEGCVRAIACGP